MPFRPEMTRTAFVGCIISGVAALGCSNIAPSVATVQNDSAAARTWPGATTTCGSGSGQCPCSNNGDLFVYQCPASSPQGESAAKGLYEADCIWCPSGEVPPWNACDQLDGPCLASDEICIGAGAPCGNACCPASPANLVCAGTVCCPSDFPTACPGGASCARSASDCPTEAPSANGGGAGGGGSGGIGGGGGASGGGSGGIGGGGGGGSGSCPCTDDGRSCQTDPTEVGFVNQCNQGGQAACYCAAAAMDACLYQHGCYAEAGCNTSVTHAYLSSSCQTNEGDAASVNGTCGVQCP